MKLENNQSILVTGAGGFIGKDVVARLLRRGWRVKAMVRGSRVPPFPINSNFKIVHADMRDGESLCDAAKDVAVVVHLAAVLSDERESEDVNVRGAERLVSACRRTGCSRIINVSTQSAKIRRKGAYARTKSEADALFHGSGLRATTLLPSIVYGEEGRGVFGALLRWIRRFPVVPVFGNGQWISAPVYIGDVSEAIVSCIEKDETIGKKYDIGGPDPIRFDDLIDTLCRESGVKRLKVHVPFELSLIIARFLATFLPRPPLTVSNVLGSNQDTEIDSAPAWSDFGFEPLSFIITYSN